MPFEIRTCELPEQSLLRRYRRADCHTDCYTTLLPGCRSQAEFVEAFYCTPLFRLERWILAHAVKRPSTDEQARTLGAGLATGFAAWKVEEQTDDQLLMCDYLQRTRSWLMSVCESGSAGDRTRLYFGSAVVHPQQVGTANPKASWPFRLLLPVHKLYSVALLWSARSRLEKVLVG